MNKNQKDFVAIVSERLTSCFLSCANETQNCENSLTSLIQNSSSNGTLSSKCECHANVHEPNIGLLRVRESDSRWGEAVVGAEDSGPYRSPLSVQTGSNSLCPR